AVPGVTSAALTDVSPLSGARSSGNITIEGQSVPEGEGPEVAKSRISPGYFRTLGVALREGRDFSDADGDGAESVVMLNQDFARRFWTNQSALGKRINNGGWWTVVGVVTDARLYSIFDAPEPMLFTPMWQNPTQFTDLQVHTAGDPNALTPAIRDVMASLDAN